MPDPAPFPFLLGGLDVRLRASDADVRRRARAGFGRWRARDGAAAAAGEPVELRVSRPARWAGARRRATGAAWRPDGAGGYAVEARGFRLAADAAARRIEADVAPAYGLGDFYRAALGLALALRDGFLLHAAALEIPGRGACLACGPSGYGKTTLSRQLPPRAVLADDAVGVRGLGGARGSGWDAEILAYPTPFFGDYGGPPRGLRPAGRPVRRLYLLSRPSARTPRHAVEPVRRSEAAAAVLGQILMAGEAPAEVRARLLDRAAALVERVPVFRLAFRPEPSIWDFLNQRM
jgi:hypothetical protein